jgi:hypothetical protein
VQGSHTTGTSKSNTFSAESGSFGAIESNKDMYPPELGCGWPEPGSLARPCRALKSNTSISGAIKIRRNMKSLEQNSKLYAL